VPITDRRVEHATGRMSLTRRSGFDILSVTWMPVLCFDYVGRWRRPFWPHGSVTQSGPRVETKRGYGPERAHRPAWALRPPLFLPVNFSHAYAHGPTEPPPVFPLSLPPRSFADSRRNQPRTEWEGQRRAARWGSNPKLGFEAAGGEMSTPARKRLMRDFKRLQQDPPAGISGAPHDNNIMLWNAVIFG
jgi:hypothetical protein